MKLFSYSRLLIVVLSLLVSEVATGANQLLNPGFESGTSSWTETSSGGYPIITNSTGSTAHAGSYYAWMGGYDGGNEVLYQNVTIPSNVQTATVQFWYMIDTTETTSVDRYDFMVVDLYSVASGVKLTTLKTLSNLDATGWGQSAQFDVSAYKGQSVQLRFTVTTDVSNSTLFMLDDVSLATSSTAHASAVTPMVAAGSQYTIALKADGTLTAWGRNDYGQLGNGQAAMRVTPAKVDGIDRVTAVAAGNGTSWALRDDGTLWSWGINGVGALGDGTNQSKSHPVQVTGLTGAVESFAISPSGGEHALAVTADGTVWAWGWGLYGQLGNGNIGDRNSAIKVSGLPEVSNAAAGYYHSLALARNGTVWAWGDNSLGQLGDGTNVSRLTPIRITALSNIVAISTTGRSNLALDSSGRVWAWGYGDWGALGHGGYSDRSTPFIVPGLPPIKSIVAGNAVSLAIATDDSVWMWGVNEFGQFGDIGYSEQPSPVKVSALAGFTSFSIGESHVAALSPSGAWQAWGENSYGRLGVGDANDRAAPVPVSASALFAQISAGQTHTVAVASDGSVWAWGSNGSGELADGTVSVSNRPVAVQGPGDSVAVAAGLFHGLALGSDGGIWAWGGNINGALGDGSRRDNAVPQRIPSLPAMLAVAAGNGLSLALEQNGDVWSWGSGSAGQLGNGQTGALLAPEKLTTISGVTQLSAKYKHVLALHQNGSVWAWGLNLHGQLGDGTTMNRSTPARVTGFTGEVVAVAAGTSHSLTLDGSGNVWAWGYNAAGQLGDGTDTDRLTPVRVVGLNNVVAISASEHNSYAITSDGRLWAWGWNGEGELGTGSLDRYSLLAHPIDGLADFQGIAAGGGGSAVALRQDGTVWAWGRNFEGQLGDATFAQHDTPVLTVNATVDGPLDLNPQVANSIPTDKIPPFFTTTDRAGDLSKFTVSTTTKFNAADVGKPGAVFITAMVPAGSLIAQQAMGRSKALGLAVFATSGAGSFVQVQLTPSGWQQVVNGQLIPYASGVLGDQLAAQAILNGADTTSLNGAEFCVGYGTSAAEMAAAGRMRAVVTIPDPNSISTVAVSCIIEGGSVATIYVLEFYNTNLDHYFITADAGEAAAIDSGSAGPGWSRTGNSFKSGGDTSVCRFYGSQSPGPNSHFYTVDASECAGLQQLQASAPDTEKRWNFESLDFVSTPASNGICPAGTAPVYRAYNNGFARGVDSNHRITGSATAIQEVVTRGWNNEGVVMCAPN